MLNQALDELVADIEDLGLTVIYDVRSLRPNTVIVDPPTMEVIKGTLVQFTFAATVLVPPPGNYDAVKSALATADTIIESETVQVARANPTVYETSGQELPGYELTIIRTIRRDP
jgi:hypothetical protein